MLPVEIWAKIFSYLDPYDIVSFSEVSSIHREVTIKELELAPVNYKKLVSYFWGNLSYQTLSSKEKDEVFALTKTYSLKAYDDREIFDFSEDFKIGPYFFCDPSFHLVKGPLIAGLHCMCIIYPKVSVWNLVKIHLPVSLTEALLDYPEESITINAGEEDVRSYLLGVLSFNIDYRLKVVLYNSYTGIESPIFTGDSVNMILGRDNGF